MQKDRYVILKTIILREGIVGTMMAIIQRNNETIDELKKRDNPVPETIAYLLSVNEKLKDLLTSVP